MVPAEAGPLCEAHPCRILRLASLPVDAEEDVADRTVVSQLRAARASAVEGAVQPSALRHRRDQHLLPGGGVYGLPVMQGHLRRLVPAHSQPAARGRPRASPSSSPISTRPTGP